MPFFVDQVAPVGNQPIPPQAQVDTTFPNTAGYTTWTVKTSGGDFTSLNTAVNDSRITTATNGVIIAVQAGQTFTEQVTLPVHTNPWVLIQSSAVASLPESTRVTSSSTSNMPTLTWTGGGGVAFSTAAGAHHYRIIGINIQAPSSVQTFWMVGTGHAVTVVSDFPNHIIFDRCYVNGPTESDTTAQCRNGIRLDGHYMAVIQSDINNIREQGGESHAIATVNGAGPYLIQNSRLEGASCNYLVGGTQDFVEKPQDITFTRNYSVKRTAWQSVTGLSIKNLFELKNAVRVLVEHNTFENNWADGQAGQGIVFKSSNQSAIMCANCFSSDIIFQYNRVINSIGVFDILTQVDEAIVPVTRVSILYNLITGAGGSDPNADRKLLELRHGSRYVTMAHNTFASPAGQTIAGITWGGTEPCVGLVIKNNILHGTAFPIIGDNFGPGNPSIANYSPDGVFLDNVFPNASGSYPANNSYPPATDSTDAAAVVYVNAAGGDYTLSSCWPPNLTGTPAYCYVNAASDGTDIGVRMGLAPGQ